MLVRLVRRCCSSFSQDNPNTPRWVGGKNVSLEILCLIKHTSEGFLQGMIVGQARMPRNVVPHCVHGQNVASSVDFWNRLQEFLFLPAIHSVHQIGLLRKPSTPLGINRPLFSPTPNRGDGILIPSSP